MERLRGTLTSWDDDRGFGFIRPADGGRDVFLHISALTAGSARPELGDALTFLPGSSPDGKPRAELVSLGRAPVAVHVPRRVNGDLAYLSLLGFLVLYWYLGTLWDIPPWIPGVYMAMCLVSFVQYGLDKRAARRRTWRASENSLLLVGLLGGWPGAIVGQQVFRHKTSKPDFQSIFRTTVVLNLIAFVMLATPLLDWFSRFVIK